MWRDIFQSDFLSTSGWSVVGWHRPTVDRANNSEKCIQIHSCLLMHDAKLFNVYLHNFYLASIFKPEAWCLLIIQ